MLRGSGSALVPLTEELGGGLLGAEPSRAAACFADEGAELAVPEARDALVAEDVPYDGDWLQGGSGLPARVGDLDFALYQLDGGEDEGGHGAGEAAREPEGLERQRLVVGGEAEAVGEVAADALPEEEGRVLEGGADEGSRDAAVEAEEAVGAEGLAEAVEGAGVAEGEVVGLGLEADFDCVEGVFDVFAHYTGDLKRGAW